MHRANPLWIPSELHFNPGQQLPVEQGCPDVLHVLTMHSSGSVLLFARPHVTSSSSPQHWLSSVQRRPSFVHSDGGWLGVQNFPISGSSLQMLPTQQSTSVLHSVYSSVHVRRQNGRGPFPATLTHSVSGQQWSPGRQWTPLAMHAAYISHIVSSSI